MWNTITRSVPIDATFVQETRNPEHTCNWSIVSVYETLRTIIEETYYRKNINDDSIVLHRYRVVWKICAYGILNVLLRIYIEMYTSIENYAHPRAFVITLVGWAGSIPQKGRAYIIFTTFSL